jgi:TetR/AcrR family transcriptional regulator
MIDKKETKERLTSEQRRIKIVEAALDMFAQKGYAGTRTREIAEAAGISETLIFQHFKSKEELYRAALSQIYHPHPDMPDIEQLMEQNDDAGVFTALARHVIDESNREPRIIRLVMYNAFDGEQFTDDTNWRETSYPLPCDLLTDYIQRRIDEGAFKKMSAQITTTLFMGNIFMYLADKQAAVSSPKPSFSDQELIKTIVDIYINGLKK